MNEFGSGREKCRGKCRGYGLPESFRRICAAFNKRVIDHFPSKPLQGAVPGVALPQAPPRAAAADVPTGLRNAEVAAP